MQHFPFPASRKKDIPQCTPTNKGRIWAVRNSNKWIFIHFRAYSNIQIFEYSLATLMRTLACDFIQGRPNRFWRTLWGSVLPSSGNTQVKPNKSGTGTSEEAILQPSLHFPQPCTTLTFKRFDNWHSVSLTLKVQFFTLIISLCMYMKVMCISISSPSFDVAGTPFCRSTLNANRLHTAREEEYLR